MTILQAVMAFVKIFFCGRAYLVAENLALRQQLAVLSRSVKRPGFSCGIGTAFTAASSGRG